MTDAGRKQQLDNLRREVGRICEGKGAFRDITEVRDFRPFEPAPTDARLREQGLVRSPSERMSFGRWVIAQEGQKGLIGRLASCACADPAFPVEGDPEAVRARLRVVMADGDMFAAVDEAELDWACY